MPSPTEERALRPAGRSNCRSGSTGPRVRSRLQLTVRPGKWTYVLRACFPLPTPVGNGSYHARLWDLVTNTLKASSVVSSSSLLLFPLLFKVISSCPIVGLCFHCLGTMQCDIQKPLIPMITSASRKTVQRGRSEFCPAGWQSASRSTWFHTVGVICGFPTIVGEGLPFLSCCHPVTITAQIVTKTPVDVCCYNYINTVCTGGHLLSPCSSAPQHSSILFAD